MFLLIHHFDVHSDYGSREHHEQLLGVSEGRVDGSNRALVPVLLGESPIEEQDAAHLARLYDAGIRQLDDELGRFFAWLRDEGWLDNSPTI